MKVLVVDYGMSNLKSVSRALEKLGAEVIISKNPQDFNDVSHIILPGVGAFGDGINNLSALGLDKAIHKAVDKGTPILGICLGMQLLSSIGYEGGETAGLNLIPGKVVRLSPDDTKVRIPHVGWNEIYIPQINPLFTKIPNGTDFYFVHSYHFVPDNQDHILSTTPYCNRFVSAVGYKNIFGVQFHPEKSQDPGFQVLKNFLMIN